jgi:putative aldouronate transport system permease protein
MTYVNKISKFSEYYEIYLAFSKYAWYNQYTMNGKINIKGFFWELKNHKVLFLMLLPTCLYFIIFSYIPMGGVFLAFTRFSHRTGLFGSPFAGWANFKQLVQGGTLWYLTKNTILYNLAFILIGNTLQIAVAIVLSRLTLTGYKRTCQSIMFLPYFVSFVIIAAFSYALFNSGTGVFTVWVRTHLNNPAFAPYTNPGIWKYIIVIVYLWKNLGYGTVIYLAAITGISEEYYEAAQVDGATVLQQIFHITIPQLVPTFIILLLLSIGNILRGQFELFYQLVGIQGQLYQATDVLDTYVFRILRMNFNVGIGTAAGLYQSVFGFVIVMTVNAVVKRNHEEYALF